MSESSRVYKTLANTFDVEDVVDVSARNIDSENQIVVAKAENGSLENDADSVRDTLYTLLQQGTEAFEDLKRIAIAEESPRAFEVMNGMLSNLSDIAVKIIEIHDKKAKIAKSSQPAGSEQQPSIVNNNLFVGTTADLQALIKKVSNDS